MRSSFSHFVTQPTNSYLLPSFRDSFHSSPYPNTNNNVLNTFPNHTYSPSLGNLSEASNQFHSNLLINDSRSFLSSLSRFPHSTGSNPNVSDPSFTSEILSSIKKSSLEGNSVPSHQMEDIYGRRSSSPASLSHYSTPQTSEIYHPSVSPSNNSEQQNQIVSLTPQSLRLQELSDASVAVSMIVQSPRLTPDFPPPAFISRYLPPALVENPNSQTQDINQNKTPSSKKGPDSKKRKDVEDGIQVEPSPKLQSRKKNKEGGRKPNIKPPVAVSNIKKSPIINGPARKNDKNLKTLQSEVEMEIGMDSELPNDDSLKNMLKIYDKFHNSEESKLMRTKRGIPR